VEIEVDITRDDYWQLNRFFMNRTFKLHWFFWPLAIGIGLVVVLLGILAALQGSFDFIFQPPLSWLLPAIVVVLALSGLLQLATRAWVKRMPREGAGTLGKHVITLTVEGVAERTDVNQASHVWSAVSEICQDDHAIYIFLDRMHAHIIPLRSFTDADAARAFREEAERLRSAAG